MRRIWSECMDAFAQYRTGCRAERLGLSQLACLGRHTLTDLVCVSGRQFVDWSADYRLYSRDVWDPHQVFVPITQGVVDLAPTGAPIVTAMDDTAVKKTGTHTPGVAYRRDPLSPAFHTNFMRGQRFLQMSGMLPHAEPAGSARAIPIAFEHSPSAPKPKKDASEEERQAYRQRKREQNLSTHGVKVIRRLREDLDGRHGAADRVLVVGVDGSYTNRTVLKNLPARTTLIGRVRKDAKLFAPPRAEDQAPVGTKLRYGTRLPTPEQIRCNEDIPWQEVEAFASGKMHTFRVKTFAPVLWKKSGAGQPLRVVVIAPVGYRPRKGSRLLYRQPAYLICTDPNLPLKELLQYYLWRWDIEVNHRDEKQMIGVGEAQVRAAQSVERQPALAVASYSILLLAAARAYGTDTPRGRLPLPKWQSKRPDERLSTQELVRQLRSEVWAHAIDTLQLNSDDFMHGAASVAKSSEWRMPAVSAMLYSATG
jgi:hypothetical protein